MVLALGMPLLSAALALAILTDVLDPGATQAIRDLTLTSALAFAVLAFVFDWVRSSRAEDKRDAAYAAQRDREADMLTTERDAWKALAERNADRADQADERVDKITEAFREVYSRRVDP